MLTVWRKLHIKVYSMGSVPSNISDSNVNRVEGQITDTKKIASGNQTLNLSVTNLEPNRFENGRLVITRMDAAGNTVTVADRRVVASSPTVTANTASSVTILNNVARFSVQNGDDFKLYDDDNMDDGIGSLNGDAGEDVSESNLDLIQSSETACIANATYGKVAGSCNGFLSAYVIPDYQEFNLSGSHTNIPFKLEQSIADQSAVYSNSSYFNNLATENNPEFWTVYMLGSYQNDYTATGARATGDPTGTTAWGRAEALTGARGLVTYIETNRPTEYEVLDRYAPAGVAPWRDRPIESKYNTLHELGHMFSATHGDCNDSTGGNAGVMRQFLTLDRGVFCDETIFKIRGGTGVINP